MEELNFSTLSTASKGFKQRRNNSTSTVQIRDTMQAPDNEATIMAVALKLRSYIEAGETARRRREQAPVNFPEDVIVEGAKKLKINRSVAPGDAENAPPRAIAQPDDLPSGSEVAAYLYNIFSTAQCSVDCTIVCLIYLERMLRTSGLALTVRNWRSLTATSMLLASKVWDDLSMVNADFAVFLGYTMEQINAWERQFLAGMKYDVRVSASQYAKYYFDLRESSLDARDPGAAPMLDMQRAQKLELLSSVVQKRVDEMRTTTAGARRVEIRRAVSDQHVNREQSDLPDAPPAVALHHHHHGGGNVVLD